MLEFLAWPESAHLSMTALILPCIAAQAVALIMGYYRWPKGKKSREQKLENALEALVLVVLVLFSVMQGHAISARYQALFAPVGWQPLRIGTVLALFAAAFGLLILKKRAWPLAAVSPALALLPFVESALGKGYPWLFCLALLFFLCRGAYIGLARYRDIRTGLSALAVKDAMDTLHSGILFCEEDGHILLINEAMQRLMRALTGGTHRNGLAFYGLLSAHSVGAQGMDGEGICIAPDGTAWMFSKWMFRLNRKVYVQISAADVTEQWRLTGELKRQNDELSRKSDELKETIANLHLLSHKKETQAARMRAHDILGNRLSLILRSLHSGDLPDRDRLAATTEGLLDEMKRGAMQSTAQDELAGLRDSFRSIGVDIRLDGDLPARQEVGKVFAEIVREAVTNAVRHGLATQVRVRMERTDQGDCLHITDNGHAAPAQIVEGGGIGGMRSRVAAHNGRLHIGASPRFTVSATIPGGYDDV